MSVRLQSGETHDFSMIDKGEHQRLLEYAQVPPARSPPSHV